MSALWARLSDESNVVVNAPTLEYDKLLLLLLLGPGANVRGD